MNIRSLVFLSVLFSCLFLACEPTTEIPEPDPNDGMLSAKIDGVLFSVSGVAVTADFIENNAQIQTLSIGGAKPPLTGVTEGLVLVVVSTDGSGIQAGDTYTATDPNQVGAAEYVFENGTLDIKAVSENTQMATITLTEIDFDTKLVSGTFRFDASDEDDPNQIYQVREGVFTDVSFK